jgi:hypothetical protein
VQRRERCAREGERTEVHRWDGSPRSLNKRGTRRGFFLCDRDKKAPPKTRRHRSAQWLRLITVDKEATKAGGLNGCGPFSAQSPQEPPMGARLLARSFDFLLAVRVDAAILEFLCAVSPFPSDRCIPARRVESLSNWVARRLSKNTVGPTITLDGCAGRPWQCRRRMICKGARDADDTDSALKNVNLQMNCPAIDVGPALFGSEIKTQWPSDGLRLSRMALRHARGRHHRRR